MFTNYTVVFCRENLVPHKSAAASHTVKHEGVGNFCLYKVLAGKKAIITFDCAGMIGEKWVEIGMVCVHSEAHQFYFIGGRFL